MQGLPELRPGDAIISRPIDAEGDIEADCMLVTVAPKWVNSSFYCCNHTTTCVCRLVKESTSLFEKFKEQGYEESDVVRMIDDVIKSRNALLGPRNQRQGGKAMFEQHWRAQPLDGTERCYGMCSMVQQPRSLAGPPAPLKTSEKGPDEYQQNVHEYLRVSLVLRHYT